MNDELTRTKMIYGREAIDSLKDKKVIVFGVGGVGGYVIEALARSGIGNISLVDNDVVSISNINRQIIATHESIGKYKVDVMKERILSINPNAIVDTFKCFYLPGNNDFDFSKYAYIVDAIDTVSAKIDIIANAKLNNVPIISSMGTGNKVNPMAFIITDISKTEMDPLAKVLRRELKKRNITKVKVCYSKEKPLVPLFNEEKVDLESKKIAPGSSAFVPGAAGLLIASEVIRDLTNNLAREELKK